MNVAADSRGPNETEDDVFPANSDTASQSGSASGQQANSGGESPADLHKPGGEEPELALEPDLPSDGRDPVGEAMIRDLPQLPELSEAPSQPHPSAQAK